MALLGLAAAKKKEEVVTVFIPGADEQPPLVGSIIGNVRLFRFFPLSPSFLLYIRSNISFVGC